MNSTRRTFLKAATSLTAGTVLSNGARGAALADGIPAFPQVDSKLLLTAEKAWEWNSFKSKGGPTYAGSTGWKRYIDFLISKMQEFGAIDLDYVDIPYDHYIVEDWPDPQTHHTGSAAAVEKLVTNGTAVPIIASYGMTSGFTPPEGITAPLLYYDRMQPPSAEAMNGKIVVFETAPYPVPPYTDQFLDSYTLTDYEWRSPGKWAPLFTPPPSSVTTSYHTRWVFSQLNGFAATGIRAKAAGLVIVYDLSPGAAFGLAQRSVYTPDGHAGVGAQYVNCPTLTLDRVNGTKVVADAKAGRQATLTLKAHFQRDTGRAILAYLPGKDYGTPRDEQILLGTHTDAMSLIEENGGIGILGIFAYFNRLPQAARPRTLIGYFDCRHFMPGGENAWPQFDYYTTHKDRLKSIVATIGIEHMGGRQTIETGPGGNRYEYSAEKPEDGGVITSLMDVHNNNIWLVEAIARAATAQHWPRVDVKSGSAAGPGVNGDLQGNVRSPMNKGRAYGIPGIGLAGDWPGAWTQTYAQLDTEAGMDGFDRDYFASQVAGLTQLASDFMRVRPQVIDLGWGELKTAITKLKNFSFMDQYVAAFREEERGNPAGAKSALNNLETKIASSVAADQSVAIRESVDHLISRF